MRDCWLEEFFGTSGIVEILKFEKKVFDSLNKNLACAIWRFCLSLSIQFYLSRRHRYIHFYTTKAGTWEQRQDNKIKSTARFSFAWMRTISRRSRLICMGVYVYMVGRIVLGELPPGWCIVFVEELWAPERAFHEKKMQETRENQRSCFVYDINVFIYTWVQCIYVHGREFSVWGWRVAATYPPVLLSRVLKLYVFLHNRKLEIITVGPLGKLRCAKKIAGALFSLSPYLFLSVSSLSESLRCAWK